MPDREKVIRAYECCKNSYDRICEKCPYEKDCCHDGIPMFVIKKMVELLKKKETQKLFVDESGKVTPLPVVVRCKDCKHRGDRHKCIVAFVAEKQEMPYFFYDNRGEWYCADGERK